MTSRNWIVGHAAYYTVLVKIVGSTNHLILLFTKMAALESTRSIHGLYILQSIH